MDHKTHTELTEILVPFLQEASEPRLSLPEAYMAGRALIDLLAPKIVEIISLAVAEEGKRIALATGRG